MIADTLKKPFYFTCDAEEGETANGAAYLMNLNTLSISGPPPIKDGEEITTANICSLCAPFQSCQWFSDSLSAGADGMRQDWSYLTNSDFVPIDDLDDVAIHLRLGDALYSFRGDNHNKGLFPSKLYINLIEQAQQEKGPIGSIGIVTAPFKGGLTRGWDFGMEDLSEKIVLSLAQALQIAFPDAKVNIRNSPEQTIMESLARLVNAPKAAVCGCSTFCPQALLATKGIGFLYLPNEHAHTNRWVRSLNTSKYENIRLFDAPLLNGLLMDNRATGEKLSDESVLFWMQHQELDVGGISITERNHTSFLVDTVS